MPLLTALAVALILLALGSLLYFGREIFVPVALAALLSFVLAPGVRSLQALRFPHGAAVISVVVAAFAAILVLATVVVSQISDLVLQVPGYRITISEKLERFGTSVGSHGSLSRAIEAIEDLSKQLGGLNSLEAPASGTPAPLPVVVREPAGLISVAGGLVSPLLHPLATTGLVLILAIFVLAQREDLRNRFIRLVGTDDLQHTTAVIDDAGRRLSKFFLTQLALNAGFGVAVAAGLWGAGVPSALLWGILAAILRFVPYVGAILSAALPLALSIAVDPGWSMLLWTAGLFLVLELVFGQVLEPLLYGHSTGLSPVAIVLSAMVWAFLWGPIGLVLATPLTVCLVVLGRHVDQLAFLEIMLGDRPALAPAEIFYQRMLAGDPGEATLQAREFLRERALATYYDEVALEGLRLAHRDIGRGRISAERQAVLLGAVKTVIRSLDNVKDGLPTGGRVSSEAAAAVVAAGPDRAGANVVVEPGDLPADWRGEAPVLCIAARDTVDEVIASMVAQVLNKQGFQTRLLHADEVSGASPGQLSDVRLSILSFLEPLSTVHLRLAVRQIRRKLSTAQVVLGIWRERDPGGASHLRQIARAEMITTTIYGTISVVQRAAGIAPDLSAKRPRSPATKARPHAELVQDA